MRKLLVLVADRNKSRLASYQAGLAQEHCAVVSVATAEDCLAMLREFTPDALVLESELPGVERVLESLSCQPFAAHVSVIMQSTLGRPTRSGALTSFPRSEQVGRPLPPKELADRVHWLTRHPRTPEKEARRVKEPLVAVEAQAGDNWVLSRGRSPEALETLRN